MLDKFLRWFSNTRMWLWYSKKILAHFTFRVWNYPKYDMNDYQKIASALDTTGAYAFALRDNASLASKLIRAIVRSQYTHAGVVLHNGDSLDTKASGLRRGVLLNVLKECDDFILVKYPLTEDNYNKYIRRVEYLTKYREFVEYDFQQELETTIDFTTMDEDLANGIQTPPPGRIKIYCSELVRILLHGLVDDTLLDPESKLKRKAFDPDLVLRADKVYEYQSGYKESGWWFILMAAILIIAVVL